MKRAWTAADVRSIADAAKLLERLGVWTVSVGNGVPRVRVGRDNLVEVIRETGSWPKVQRHGTGESWEVTVQLKGVQLFALADDEQLSPFGYQAKSELVRITPPEEPSDAPTAPA